MKTKAAALMFALAAPMLASACAPYEAEPVSVYQWERKVQEVERREAERQRLLVADQRDPALPLAVGGLDHAGQAHPRGQGRPVWP